MQLIPWKNKDNKPAGQAPAAPVAQFRSEFDRLVDRFFSDPWGNMPFGGEFPGGGDFTPALEVVEGEDELVVRAEVPGVEPKDIDLSVAGEILTISGEKRQDTMEEGENWHHSERHYGAFRRSLRLPATVDADKVSAEYDKGVLTIHLPRTAASQARRIQVKGG
jgi:HSP20 family protein